ncbi:hypothetical protein AB0K18_43100 [Nonomuraea sp. NPDC049421]|uniref:hypothetical protein n=1 Tax=Nonomuraea sp. NPDC049421 TaxID=3155275 RepID=UPI0034312C9F
MITTLNPETRTLTTAHNQITIAYADKTRQGRPGVILAHVPDDGSATRYTVHTHHALGWIQISSSAILEPGAAKTLLKSDYEVSATTHFQAWQPMLDLLNLALPTTAKQVA